MIDVCIISDGKTKALRDMTQKCIDGAKENESDTIFLSESAWVSTYKNLDFLSLRDGDFNYNRELNHLAKGESNPYIAFCNNDLVFTKGWAKELIDCMQESGADSASPFCPVAHYAIHGEPKWRYKQGYHTRKYLAGWCFVMKRDFWEKNKLPEEYSFWCADNATELMLRQKKAKHILCSKSIVKHLGGKTTALLDEDTKNAYTVGNVKKWNRNTGENKFNYGK
jgi:hypothetical protein